MKRQQKQGLALLLLLPVLLTLTPPARATSPDEFREMLAALNNRGIFRNFIELFRRADRVAMLTSLPLFEFFPVTFLVPTDAAFNSLPQFYSPWNYRNFRCSNLLMPDGCSVPIILYHMFPFELSEAELTEAPLDTQWRSLEGSSVQKYALNPGNSGKFKLGPNLAVEPWGWGATSIPDFARIWIPNAFKSENITVHVIDSILPPPSLYPAGFLKKRQ